MTPYTVSFARRAALQVAGLVAASVWVLVRATPRSLAVLAGVVGAFWAYHLTTFVLRATVDGDTVVLRTSLRESRVSRDALRVVRSSTPWGSTRLRKRGRLLPWRLPRSKQADVLATVLGR